MGIPDSADSSDRWSIDHVFLDQDGIPTLVEVKRSTDTRIRREVVGQMLDYAANAVVHWPIEKLQAEFETSCRDANVSPEEKLREVLGNTASESDFWAKVKTNLQAGKVRLLFIADDIPSELRRIIEFLNEQMDPAEVLGVEIKQFIGDGVQSLVPRVIGQTAEAETRKGRQRPKRQWDEESFLNDLRQRRGDEEVQIARTILDWAKTAEQPLSLLWGSGHTDGTVTMRLDDERGKQYVCTLSSNGKFGVPFGWMRSTVPFSDTILRTEFLRKIKQVNGVGWPAESIEKWPYLDFEFLKKPASLNRLLEALDWAALQIVFSRDA